jgi:hypothetical protein
MCHNPDNFEPLAEVCAGVQTILAGEPSILLGPAYVKKLFYYDFRGFYVCLCEIRTISATWLRSVSQSGQYRAAEFFLRPDNSRLG